MWFYPWMENLEPLWPLNSKVLNNTFLFITFYKIVTFQLKPFEQFFPAAHSLRDGYASYSAQIIMLNRMVLTFESLNKIRRRDHWNESYWAWAALSCGTVCYAVQGCTNFESVDKNKSYSVIDHSNESYWAVLITFLWCCLLCSTGLKLLSLWVKSGSVTIQLKATDQYVTVGNCL